MRIAFFFHSLEANYLLFKENAVYASDSVRIHFDDGQIKAREAIFFDDWSYLYRGEFLYGKRSFEYRSMMFSKIGFSLRGVVYRERGITIQAEELWSDGELRAKDVSLKLCEDSLWSIQAKSLHETEDGIELYDGALDIGWRIPLFTKWRVDSLLFPQIFMGDAGVALRLPISLREGITIYPEIGMNERFGLVLESKNKVSDVDVGFRQLRGENRAHWKSRFNITGENDFGLNADLNYWSDEQYGDDFLLEEPWRPFVESRARMSWSNIDLGWNDFQFSNINSSPRIFSMWTFGDEKHTVNVIGELPLAIEPFQSSLRGELSRVDRFSKLQIETHGSVQLLPNSLEVMGDVFAGVPLYSIYKDWYAYGTIGPFINRDNYGLYGRGRFFWKEWGGFIEGAYNDSNETYSLFGFINHRYTSAEVFLRPERGQVSFWYQKEFFAVAMAFAYYDKAHWYQARLRWKYSSFISELTTSFQEEDYRVSGRIMYELPCACIDVGAEFVAGFESQNIRFLMQLPQRF